MANGLLGLGGLSSAFGAPPPAGLLGPYYDPKQMKNQMFKQALLGAGIGLLTNGKGSTAEVLGQGLAGGLQAANNAGINYKNDVMGYNQLAQQMEEQKAKQEEKQRLMDWVSKQPPEMQNFLAVNPEAGAKMWQEQKIKGMFPAPPEPYTLGPDQLRFENGKMVARGLPKTPDSVINNSIDMKGEGAYSIDRNKAFAKRADEIDTAEQAAFKTLNSLNQMENLIQDPSFYSGFGADQLRAIKSAAVALGGDPNQVSSMEQFNTLSKQAALDTMGGSLGTGFSNADRDFVVEQVPYLGNTPEGNKAVIAINRKMQERKIQIAKMAREYEVQNGRIDARFMQELAQWAEANPLFAGMAAPPQGGTGKTSTGVPWKVLP